MKPKQIINKRTRQEWSHWIEDLTDWLIDRLPEHGSDEEAINEAMSSNKFVAEYVAFRLKEFNRVCDRIGIDKDKRPEALELINDQLGMADPVDEMYYLLE